MKPFGHAWILLWKTKGAEVNLRSASGAEDCTATHALSHEGPFFYSGRPVPVLVVSCIDAGL